MPSQSGNPPNGNPQWSDLDMSQIIQRAFEESTDRLRVDAEVSAVIGEVVIDASTSSVAIGDRNTGNLLKVNADGSIDADVILNAATDNVAISDGTDTLAINTDGSINVELEGLASFQTSGYIIGTSAVQLTVIPLANRSSVGFKAVCSGSNAIYIGNSSSVTTANGWPLFDHDALELDLKGTQQVWAISNAMAQSLYVVELG